MSTQLIKYQDANTILDKAILFEVSWMGKTFLVNDVNIVEEDGDYTIYGDTVENALNIDSMPLLCQPLSLRDFRDLSVAFYLDTKEPTKLFAQNNISGKLLLTIEPAFSQELNPLI